MRRNRLWFTADTHFRTKVAYYGHLPLSFARLALRQRRVKYLGHDFFYDNVATPLNLQSYPNEITRCILRNLPEIPTTVLDIGGNIGQFSATLAHFVDLELLDVFEPNPTILPLLEKNLAHLGERANIHNFAISDQEAEFGVLYFQPGRSAIGSMFASNAGDPESVTEVDIRFVTDPVSVTGRSSYDLVKIDVEGFEIEVVSSLKNVSTRFLYIEVSGSQRERTYTDGELMSAISSSFGDYTILYSSGSDSHDITYELLLDFKPALRVKSE